MCLLQLFTGPRYHPLLGKTYLFPSWNIKVYRSARHCDKQSSKLQKWCKYDGNFLYADGALQKSLSINQPARPVVLFNQIHGMKTFDMYISGMICMYAFTHTKLLVYGIHRVRFLLYFKESNLHDNFCIHFFLQFLHPAHRGSVSHVQAAWFIYMRVSLQNELLRSSSISECNLTTIWPWQFVFI